MLQLHEYFHLLVQHLEVNLAVPQNWWQGFEQVPTTIALGTEELMALCLSYETNLRELAEESFGTRLSYLREGVIV